LIIIAVSLFSSSAYGQIKIVDSISGQPLPATTVFTSNGNLGIISDMYGNISLEALHKLFTNNDDKKQVSLQHIGYDSKNIPIKELKQLTVIKLTGLNNTLPDIAVKTDAKGLFCIARLFSRLSIL